MRNEYHLNGDLTFMDRFLKIIFWLSICAIVLLIAIPIIKSLLPVEFVNDRYQGIYDGFRVFGLGVAILLTLTGTIKKKDKIGEVIGKIVLTLFALLIPFCIMFTMIFNGMCRWVNDKPLFVNDRKPSRQIVLRSYGCGAVDSGSPKYGVFEIRDLSFGLIWVTKTDTLSIDRTVWIRTTEKE
jgi:hypothetical protein